MKIPVACGFRDGHRTQFFVGFFSMYNPEINVMYSAAVKSNKTDRCCDRSVGYIWQVFLLYWKRKQDRQTDVKRLVQIGTHGAVSQETVCFYLNCSIRFLAAVC